MHFLLQYDILLLGTLISLESGVLSLKVSYKKLWKLLIDMETNKKTLSVMANVSGATVTKLAKGESVNMEMLIRICTALKCNLHDIVEIVPDGADEDDSAVIKPE